ncbi:MAG: ATP-binding cassette domain-containing protein [Verrucomicrobiota bacterium]
MGKNRVNPAIIYTDDFEAEDTVLECRGVGICYKKPLKLGKSSDRRRREFWPFRGVNMVLKKGETLGIVGRNGAGKSTLLRLLAGVTAPDEGNLFVRRDLRVQLLSINLGFEKILTGRENAIMAGMLLGKSREAMLERIEQIKEFSELGDFFDEPVYSYSSGMRARLGFSAAIEADPDLLLLDEILAVGDKQFKEKSRKVTRSLIDSGKSVVIVMHDRSFINKNCDKVLELDQSN